MARASTALLGEMQYTGEGRTCAERLAALEVVGSRGDGEFPLYKIKGVVT